MRRILRRRTKRTLAVSTVIANMMMISITLGLAAILIAWTGSTYGLFTSGSQIFYAQRGQALQERLVVENAFFNKTAPGGARLLVFVRNVGAEEVKVVALYVNGTYLPPTGTNPWLCTSTPATIPVGSVCEFNLNYGPTFPTANTGTIFYIIVASARGNRATFTVRLP